jgi:hypothetical protein
LEHGNDVGAAAEFILNDVLSLDEGTSSHAPSVNHSVSNVSSQDVERIVANEEIAQALVANEFGNGS